jgi:septal ring factor EnvC (AmiA/AmiB activator)
MNNDWTALVTSALSVLGAGGGLAAATAAVMRWRNTRAEAADVITDTALILIEPLKERIKELESDIGRLRSEVLQTADELRRIRIVILDPATTLEELRVLADPSRHNWTSL